MLKENLNHLLILVFVSLSISYSYAQNSEIKLKSESKNRKTVMLPSADKLSDQNSASNNSISIPVSELYAWCNHYNVSVFSKEQYDAMSDDEKSNVDRMPNKIIFEGTELSVEDIKAYKQSKN